MVISRRAVGQPTCLCGSIVHCSNLCKNFSLSITAIIAQKKYFRKYGVINDDVITFCSHLCGSRKS